MNFLNEAAFAYCSVRGKKKNGINLEELRLASLCLSHTLAPTLADDLPVFPFFLKTSNQLQVLGLRNYTFVMLHITCSLHCEKTDSYLHLRRK